MDRKNCPLDRPATHPVGETAVADMGETTISAIETDFQKKTEEEWRRRCH